MHCHECARVGAERMAVAICRSRSVALCKDHLVSSFYSDRVPQYGCDHHPDRPFPRRARRSARWSGRSRAGTARHDHDERAGRPHGAVRPKHPAAPVYLLDVHAVRGERTRADGALWDGVLNATPDDTNDAPSPIEALMAALAGCLVRNLRSMADGRRITLERVDLHLAATRSDDPPTVTSLIVDLDVVADAEPERVQRMVEQALRYGTITRTLARACPLVINLSVGGVPAALDVEALLATDPTEDG